MEVQNHVRIRLAASSDLKQTVFVLPASPTGPQQNDQIRGGVSCIVEKERHGTLRGLGSVSLDARPGVETLCFCFSLRSCYFSGADAEIPATHSRLPGCSTCCQHPKRPVARPQRPCTEQNMMPKYAPSFSRASCFIACQSAPRPFLFGFFFFFSCWRRTC